MPGLIEENVTCTGVWRFTQIPVLPASTVSDSQIASGAAIGTAKMRHKHRKHYAQPNTAAADETRMLHVVFGTTGTIVAFKAGSIAICIGAATVTVDLKKNGASILTAVITLDSANTARVAEAGAIATPGLVVGDVLEIVIDETAGGGTVATGVFCELEVDEDAV